MKNIIIYKITNQINGKSYVGKANNYERRMSDHFSPARRSSYHQSNKPLYLAMDKYGQESFTKEILEYVGEEDWKRRERFWIAKENSIAPSGYNLTPGGDSTYINREDASGAIFSQKEVDEIFLLLYESDYTMGEIAEIYNCPKSRIWQINRGETWNEGKHDYPIRKPYHKSDKEIEEVRDMIINSRTPLNKISEMFGKSKTWASEINQGIIHRDHTLKYPLRKTPYKYKNPVSVSKGREAQIALITTDILITQVGPTLNYNKGYGSKVNNGTIHKDSEFIYPLRKNKNKNLEILKRKEWFIEKDS